MIPASETDTDGDCVTKTTLFCPDCGHQSRLDGDWQVLDEAGPVRYRCPECENRLGRLPLQ
ncbi:hypothetical protein BRD09_01720 [Halobacteriales archaeon SW_10_68_16]|nr:MAG: hypothetical protein BRD09_01720 [Halobacteriales archaeon SW_10_68_16]